jgi:hypothetical protein
MSLTLPDDLTWVLNLLGFMWPEADEDKLRASAQAWRVFGAEVTRIKQEASLVAAQVTADNSSESIDAFERYWHGLGGGGGDFDRAKEAADHMATALDGMAALVVGVKWAVIAQLGALAAEIVGDQVAAPVTLGLSEGAMVGEVIITRGILRRIIQEGIHQVGREIVQQLKGRVLELLRRILATRLRRALAGATFAGGTDLAKQELDINVFHSRTHVDLRELGATTATGGVIAAVVPVRARDRSRLDRGDGRDPGGRFTGKGGYGKSGEATGLARYEAQEGRPVIKQQIRVSTDGKDTRFYDGLSLKPDGTYDAVEVKSGDASPNAHQRAFDATVRSGTPATGILNGKPIVITSVTYIQVRE